VNWDEHFENHKSRRNKKTSWVPIPNSFSGDRISDLIDLGGCESYATFVAMVLIASTCEPRGLLVRKNGNAHNPRSMARITGLQEKDFKSMISISLNSNLICIYVDEDTTRTLKGRSEDASRAQKERKKERKKERTPPVLHEFPKAFSPKLRTAFLDWIEYREQAKIKGAHDTEIGWSRLMKKWGSIPEARALAAIDNSITNGYQGIYEPKTPALKLTTPPTTTPLKVPADVQANLDRSKGKQA